MQNKEQFMRTLGLCQRAQKCIVGDKLMDAIRKKKVYLVIVAEDASDRTKKQYTTKTEYYDVKMEILLTKEEISQAIGKDNRVAVGISDRGFSDVLLKYV